MDKIKKNFNTQMIQCFYVPIDYCICMQFSLIAIFETNFHGILSKPETYGNSW